MRLRPFQITAWLLTLLGVGALHRADAATPVRTARKHATARRSVQKAGTKTRACVLHANAAGVARVSAARRRRGKAVFFSPWTEPTFADSTVGDKVEGEDAVVRRAAMDALGLYNGTVVVADPETGRILSIVNQKVALQGAYQPCSTIKTVVSLASLSEGLVSANSNVHLTRRYSMDLTQAIAHSNNLYFAKLGQQLGFEETIRLVYQTSNGTVDGLQCFSRGTAVKAWLTHAILHLLHQGGHADHKELVQIRAKYRQELYTF